LIFSCFQVDDADHILKKEELSQIIKKINPGILVLMYYRLGDLEDEGNPSNLGSIDQFVETRENELQLERQKNVLQKQTLRDYGDNCFSTFTNGNKRGNNVQPH